MDNRLMTFDIARRVIANGLELETRLPPGRPQANWGVIGLLHAKKH